MTKSLARNYKTLKKDLDLQWDPIEEGHILTNRSFVSRYQNHRQMMEGAFFNK